MIHGNFGDFLLPVRGLSVTLSLILWDGKTSRDIKDRPSKFNFGEKHLLSTFKSLLQYYEMHFDNLTKHSGFGEEIGCKCFHYGEKHINLIQIFPKTTIPILTKQIG